MGVFIQKVIQLRRRWMAAIASKSLNANRFVAGC